MQDILNVRQLILAAAGGVAYPVSDLVGRENNRRQKKNQNPGQPATQHDHKRGREDQREDLLQEFRQHARHGVLHPLDVVDDGREQGARGVLLEEGRRPPQDGGVHVIAQVGDHAEPGIADQVRSGVVENALQQGRRHQRERHDGPGILEV